MLLTVYDRIYPFGWLGILAEAKPFPEMSYSNHERGFALASRRSPKLSRLYVQCAADDDLAGWPDRRIWDELHTRLYDKDGGELQEGPILQQAVMPLRAYVAAPMRHGRMFLAGDAAHIVPPTGAKGLNLAAADVRVLSRALIEFFRTGATERLDRYSDTCLKRVWKVVRYSNYMTSLLHRFETHSTVRAPRAAGRAGVCRGLARGADHDRRKTTSACRSRRIDARRGASHPAHRLARRENRHVASRWSSRRRSRLSGARPARSAGAGLSVAPDQAPDPYAAGQPGRCARPSGRRRSWASASARASSSTTAPAAPP